MEVRIERLGARGDGIAETPDGPVYVSGAVPGDLVDVSLGDRRGEGHSAKLLEIVAAGPERREPSCSHFGVCGGCVLQHVDAATYLSWKRDRLFEALRQHGIVAEVGETVSVSPGSRRRVRLAFRAAGGRMLLGFREARSERIVDVHECPVANPVLVALLPDLRSLLAKHAGKGEVAVTATDTGLDVAVFADREPSLDLRLDAPEFCAAAGVARLVWATGKGTTEPLITLEMPRVSFGAVEVTPPPDAFLQPTAEGEAVLREAVLALLGSPCRVVDLFAGCGAFSLPLADAGFTVHAVEGLAQQTAAISRADHRISTETRDLARRPMMREELARFDGAILDPPRAGAREQAAELAGSTLKRIVYVSCNPATFARDARLLVDAGFTLSGVRPVDQFLWSHHVELVSVFRKN